MPNDSISAQPAPTAVTQVDLVRFSRGIREFMLGQLSERLSVADMDKARGVDLEWLVNVMLDGQGLPPAFPDKPVYRQPLSRR